MKILCIMGTTRDGNTNQVTRQLIEEMQKLGEVDVEFLNLKDKHLEFCRGCHNCILRGEQYCPLQDDRDEIIAQMDDADAFIFVSPGYVFNVSAVMKNYFDRLAYFCHRPRYLEKKSLLLSTSSPWCTKATLKAMRIFAGGLGTYIIEELGIAVYPMRMQPALIETNNQKIACSAKKFYAALAQNKARPPLKIEDLAFFRAMRSLAKNYPHIMQADYQFYTQIGAYEKGAYWFKKHPVNPLKKLFASFIEKQMLGSFNKMFITEEEEIAKK